MHRIFNPCTFNSLVSITLMCTCSGAHALTLMLKRAPLHMMGKQFISDQRLFSAEFVTHKR